MVRIETLIQTGLAATPQSSARAAFATAHLTERHFSSIIRGSHKKKNRFRGSFLWQACTKKIFFLISCTDSNFSLLMYIIAYFAKKHKRFSIFALTFFLSNYNP